MVLATGYVEVELITSLEFSIRVGAIAVIWSV
jgi:hypothetical protein